MDIWHGEQGLEVYEEIHQEYLNQMIHFAFLPGVFYGTFRGIPALLNIKTSPFIVGLSTFYGIYYALAYSIYGGVGTMIYTAPFAFLAGYHTHTRRDHIREALVIAGSSLLIQEVVGHTILEEINSRLTISFVFNAITYSPLFYLKYVPIFPILYLVQILTVLALID